jgi:hypothetical protein
MAFSGLVGLPPRTIFSSRVFFIALVKQYSTIMIGNNSAKSLPRFQRRNIVPDLEYL